MKIAHIKYVIDNIRHRKLRSWLTVISILIGIMAIYALVSFGQGLSDYINSFAAESGSDKLFVQAKSAAVPGTDKNFYISTEDIEFLSKVNGINEIVGMYFDSAEIQLDQEKKYTFVISMPTGPELEMVMEMFTVKVIRGRNLKTGDKLKTVLGYNYQFPNKIFKKAIDLNEKVLLNGETVEVVGFFEEVGNPQDDSQIYLTEEGFLLLYPDTENKYQLAIARSDPGEYAPDVALKAEEKLRKHQGVEEGNENFFIQTFEQAIETFSTVLLVINAILVLIAFISLIVAAVNIMNTMYTAVLERTNEIGVMKAIGAKNSDILFIFVLESGILGMIGGALGIIAGYGIARLGGFITAQAGYAAFYPVFPIWLTIGCLLFAFLVGVAAGFFPARQAAKLKPVDALRYE